MSQSQKFESFTTTFKLKSLKSLEISTAYSVINRKGTVL